MQDLGWALSARASLGTCVSATAIESDLERIRLQEEADHRGRGRQGR